MGEYTPTTDYSQVVPDSTIPFTHHVREMYALGKSSISMLTLGERKAEFDRWLASRDAELLERVAQRVERGRKLNHETHTLPYCPNCHANDVRDEIAKEIREGK